MKKSSKTRGKLSLNNNTMKKKKPVRKLAFGGKNVDPLQAYLDLKRKYQSENPLRIEAPGTALAENEMALAKADQAVNDNFWTQGLDALGAYAMNQGAGMMQQGIASGELTNFADGTGLFGAMKGNNTKGMTEIPGATVKRMALGGRVTGGGGDDKKKGQRLSADVHAATGITFDPSVANRLFDYPAPAGSTPKRQLNLGAYKDAGYFDVKDQGSNFQVAPTANNPQNAQGYKDMITYLKKLNPDVQIADNGYRQFKKRMALGGPIGPEGLPVEVEGEEVGELPNGELVDFEGPTHEQGGIPVSMPKGSEIFSDRIKIDGVSMADRKKKRKKREMTLEKLMEEDPTDALVKNTMERTFQVNEQEDQFDSEMQEFIGAQMQAKFPENDGMPKAAYGWPPNDPYDPDNEEYLLALSEGLVGGPNPANTGNAWNMEPKEDGQGWLQKGAQNMAMPTFGDALGIYGNMQQGQVPLDVLYENRAGDTPNSNAFLDFGKDGLKAIDEAKGYVSGQKDAAGREIDIAKNNMMSRNRGGARGINTMRALDLAANQSATNSKASIGSEYSKMMLDLLGKESGMLNARDAQVMAGEAGRDLADRQDRGSFYSELAKAKMNKAKSNSLAGGSLNKLKERKVTGDVLNNMFDYVQMNPMTGQMEAKPGAVFTAKAAAEMSKFDYKALGYTEKEWNALSDGQKSQVSLTGQKI